MEVTWLVSLLLLFLTLTILTLRKFSNSQKNASTKLPPGPPKLPIIGNLHQLAAKNALPQHRLAELAREYGPFMHLRLGELPTVIVSSADVAREVMKIHDAACCSRPTSQLSEHVMYGSTDIVFAPYGEYWRQVRKIATLELLTTKRIRSFQPITEEEVANLVKLLAMVEGSVVNLSNMLFGLTFDITSRLAFKKKGKDQEEFKALIADLTEASSGFSICDLYPSVKVLSSMTGTRRKFQDIVRRSNQILDPIINDHLSKKGKSKDFGDQDLVDVLLTFHNKDNNTSSQGSKFSLKIDNIKAIVLELFGAGSETSSVTVEWAMSELIKNPEIMKKAQDEVRRVLKLQGEEIMMNETSLDELKYLNQVIKETLRLHPPFPLLVPRELMEECQILGYELPIKTRVLINAWAIGRDVKYWQNPENFDPGRFENSLVDYKGTHFEFIPFGAGRRMCPGIGLGLANVVPPLAMLLYHFDWNLPDGIKSQDLNMDETFGLVARRKHELLVIPSIYHQSIFE